MNRVTYFWSQEENRITIAKSYWMGKLFKVGYI